MNKFFKYCLLAVVFIVLTFSIPFSYCAGNFSTESIGTDSTDNSTFIITNNVNMSKFDDAYYCDILGGIIDVRPLNDSFKANVLSTKRIKLKIDNIVINLAAHTLYALSLDKQEKVQYLIINDTPYELTSNTFTLDFSYIGAFGNFKTEYFTTYHDKIIKLPVLEDLKVSHGSAKIINGELYLYPEPITEASDTATQHVVYDSLFRLSYYSITNNHCVTEALSIDTDVYSVSEEYRIVSVSPTDTNATPEIIGNNIKFTIKGEYRITLTKNTYKYVINLTVNIPDVDTVPNPPEPDLPPDDNNDNDNSDIIVPPNPPDDGELLPPNDSENIPPDNNTELPPTDNDNSNESEPPSPPDESNNKPPDNNNADNSKPQIPPDESESLKPDTAPDNDNSGGGASEDNTAPPIEEILPPNNDSSIIDDVLDLNINYESKIDYAKVIIVAVCAIFIIGGIATFAVIFIKIKKRK